MAYVTFEDLYGSIELLVFPSVLSKYFSLIKPGEIILVRGRINAREDESPKIIADYVEYAPRADKADGLSPHKHKKSAPPGLYLRICSEQSEDYRRASMITAVFEGSVPLYIRFDDNKKLMRAPKSMYVSPNDIMLEELKRLLGRDNVILID